MGPPSECGECILILYHGYLNVTHLVLKRTVNLIESVSLLQTRKCETLFQARGSIFALRCASRLSYQVQKCASLLEQFVTRGKLTELMWQQCILGTDAGQSGPESLSKLCEVLKNHF